MILAALVLPNTILIQGGKIIDGTGRPGYYADLRIESDRIKSIGHLKPTPGEKVINAKGLIVAPGFIDAHSHALGGIEKDPTTISQLTQGITTAVGGQDGGWSQPVAKEFADIERIKPTINFALFSGHGGIRKAIMGDNYKRLATKEEIRKMTALVAADMKAGALGLSSGLEYDPGYYSNTNELIAIAKAARPGLYISHVRDEADKSFEAFEEAATIKSKAKLPAQISHIKLGSKAVWGQAKRALKLLDQKGLTADFYPYPYWQSTIAALSPSRDWENDNIWVKALDDVGGPANVRLTTYTPNPSWQGKTLQQLSEQMGKTPIKLIQEILRTTNEEGRQSVVVTAMQDVDLEAFARHPMVMFCSDGSIGGSHPRGAGSFPRVLATYVRERKTLSLAEAIRKMTSLTAKTFQLGKIGRLKPGYQADITVFDASTIQDHATPEKSTTLSSGVHSVVVNGVLALENGQLTGNRSGRVIRRASNNRVR